MNQACGNPAGNAWFTIDPSKVKDLLRQDALLEKRELQVLTGNGRDNTEAIDLNSESVAIGQHLTSVPMVQLREVWCPERELIICALYRSIHRNNEMLLAELLMNRKGLVWKLH